MFGWAMELVARVQTPSGANQTMSVRVDTTLRQTLRIAGIMVGYDGPMSTAPNAPNLQLPLPTLNKLQNTAAITLLMFQVENWRGSEAPGISSGTFP